MRILTKNEWWSIKSCSDCITLLLVDSSDIRFSDPSIFNQDLVNFKESWLNPPPDTQSQSSLGEGHYWVLCPQCRNQIEVDPREIDFDIQQLAEQNFYSKLGITPQRPQTYTVNRVETAISVREIKQGVDLNTPMQYIDKEEVNSL